MALKTFSLTPKKEEEQKNTDNTKLKTFSLFDYTDKKSNASTQKKTVADQPGINSSVLTNKGGFGTDAIAPTTIVDEEAPKNSGEKVAGTESYYTPTTASFTPSNTYLKAMEYTNSLLQQLSSGRTSYTDQINALMNQIQNRDAFSYDMDNDTLFQNSLQSAMASGKVAMQDTMGQASALTGGYGSTYATSAANQAYNGYIQDAYANLPDYYNLALEAYNMEGQNLYNQLGMYQDADNTEYSRLANAYSANMQNAADMYDKEYNNYWQTQNFNENSRQFNANLAYKNAQQAQDQADWEKEYELSLAKASASGSNLDVSKDMKEIGTSLYNQYGENGKQFSQWFDELSEKGYTDDQLTELYDYITKVSGDKPTLNFAAHSASGDKNKDQYKDQWGNKYTYEELKELGLLQYIEGK